MILDKQKQNGLYKVIDFQKELAARLGAAINKIRLPDVNLLSDSMGAQRTQPAAITANTSTVFSPTISVGITHNGEMNDSAAESFGERVANTAIDLLHDAFERRGIGSLGSSKLRQ